MVEAMIPSQRDQTQRRLVEAGMVSSVGGVMGVCSPLRNDPWRLASGVMHDGPRSL